MKKIQIIILSLLLALMASQSFAAENLDYQIIGVKGKPLKNVRARLDELKRSLSPLNKRSVKQLASMGTTHVKQALEPFGYFRAKVSLKLERRGDRWVAHYAIIPGTPLTITDIHFAVVGPGSQLPEFQKIKNKLPFKKGEIFLSASYEGLKNTLFETAESLGYINAQLIEHQVVVDPARTQAEIKLKFATGKRYHFSKTHFKGSQFETLFLERFLPYEAGDPYSSNTLMELQEQMAGSRFFSATRINPLINKEQTTDVPVEIIITPRKKYQYTLGLGYGTDTGIRGKAGWEWRRVTQTGHQFNSALQLSQINQSLSAEYLIPGLHPLTDYYSIGSEIKKKKTTQGRSNSLELNVSKVQAFYDWQQTVRLSYRMERFETDGGPQQLSRLLVPSIHWTQTLADDPLRTMRGHRYSLLLRGGIKGLLSDTSFFQLLAQAKTIFPVMKRDRVILRGELGFTAVNDINDLPLSYRFFAGGAQSVRGYIYESLGEGLYLMTASAEYQKRIADNWFFAAYYDVGNAVNTLKMPLKSSIGLGPVWISPVGSIQFSIAKPLDQTQPSYRIIFSMGSDL